MMRNLGATTLRRRARSGDPMDGYDALPTPLRHWLSQAARPWSPSSVRRLWARARAQGLDTRDVLQALSRAEARTLARDRHSTIHTLNTEI